MTETSLERWRATLDALDGIALEGDVQASDAAADEADEVRRLIAVSAVAAGAAPGAWRRSSLPAMWYRRGRPTLGVVSPEPERPGTAGAPTPVPEPPADGAPLSPEPADPERRHRPD